MRSARSCFNLTLYKKNLTRFWPIWGLYLVIWLFLFPIGLILDNYSSPFRFANRVVLERITEIGLPLAVAFALLSAMAVWSYLYNNRSVCLMHTLPIRRGGLFCTSFLSGMTFMAGPNLVVFVLTLLAEAAMGEVDAGALVMWFFAVTLMELFFFCFATLCAMCTGHVLGLPAFYAIFNGLAFGLMYLIDLTLSRFVFGFTGVTGMYGLVEWLTPVWKLGDHLEVRRDYVNGELLDETAWLSGFGYILVYAILGLIFMALALALYRRRQMERAGDIVAVPWMRPIFLYGVAFCCALAFGTLLFELFRYTLDDSAWALLVFLLLCGAAGYFIAKMLLEKSFRVFHYWRGCLPLLGALVVLTCAMEFDLTGYERRVPRADQVESVTIYNLNTMPYDSGDHLALETGDPQVIQAVLAAHQSVVDHKGDIESEGLSSLSSRASGFQVTYTLTDGGALTRDYDYEIPVFEEDLDVPGSPTALLDALANLPQAVEECYGLSGKSAEGIIEMTLSGYFADDESEWYDGVTVSKDAYETVFAALMADFAEGNIGRRYLMHSEERMNNCFVNDLEIVFYRGESEDGGEAFTMVNGAVVPVPVTVIDEDAEKAVGTQSIIVTLQTTSRHTLAALAQLGVLEKEVPLLTQTQLEQANTAWDENGESWEGIDLKDYAWDILGG